jgi:hypothetical protein
MDLEDIDKNDEVSLATACVQVIVDAFKDIPFNDRHSYYFGDGDRGLFIDLTPLDEPTFMKLNVQLYRKEPDTNKIVRALDRNYELSVGFLD